MSVQNTLALSTLFSSRALQSALAITLELVILSTSPFAVPESHGNHDLHQPSPPDFWVITSVKAAHHF